MRGWPLVRDRLLGEDEVSAHSIGEVLFITNTTSARIYYFAVGRETAAHINWAPHLGREKSVDKGAAVRIHHEDIYRSETEQEAIVFWWHALERDVQREPGEIQSLVVGL